MQIEPSDPVIAFNLSHVLMKLGDWQEARRYLTKVLALDPNYAEAWYNLASIARDHKDVEAARRYLQKAIAADPIYPDPVYNLALLEFDCRRVRRGGTPLGALPRARPRLRLGPEGKAGAAADRPDGQPAGRQDRPKGRRAASRRAMNFLVTGRRMLQRACFSRTVPARRWTRRS